MNRLELAQEIKWRAYLQGKFVLRSGVITDRYFDKYQFESDPELLREISEAMVPLVPSETDVLAGLELGGIPLATMLSQLTDLPTLFVRKQAKTYGTRRLAEGGRVDGQTLTIVEDIVTTAGQIMSQARSCHRPDHVKCTAVDRSRRQSKRRDCSHRQGSRRRVQLGFSRNQIAFRCSLRMRFLALDPRNGGHHTLVNYYHSRRNPVENAMSQFFEYLEEAQTSRQSLLCVGLDPRRGNMPVDDLAGFTCAIIDATSDIASSRAELD